MGSKQRGYLCLHDGIGASDNIFKSIWCYWSQEVQNSSVRLNRTIDLLLHCTLFSCGCVQLRLIQNIIMTTLKNLFENKIIAIIRGIRPKDVLNIANDLYKAGIKIIEISVNSTDALSVINKLIHNIGDRMIRGAGTVLDVSSARLAIDAGAKLSISPGYNEEKIQVTKQFGAVSFPGALTPTEIILPYNSGGDIIKLLPASNVVYFKNIRSFLNHILLMPTGGITLNNIKAFKKEGAVAFGIGSSLVNALNPVNAKYSNELKVNEKHLGSLYNQIKQLVDENETN